MSKKLDEIYRERYVQEGNSPKGFFWNNVETQQIRFEKLLNMIPKDKPLSIHDVGCGTGHLREYAVEQGYQVDYSGCEVVPEMVADFKKTQKGCLIKEGAFLDIDYEDGEKYDYLVVSGLFNMPGDQKDSWQEFCEMTLKKMWDLSNKGIVVNFLTSYSTFTDESLFYPDPKMWMDFFNKNCSRFIKIDHGYPLFEYSMAVYKPEAMKEQYPQEAFSKYFGDL